MNLRTLFIFNAAIAIVRALAVTYGVGLVLALVGTFFGPFNALGWIAVGFNVLLGTGFAYFSRAGSGHSTRAG